MNTSEQRPTVKRDFLFIVPEFALQHQQHSHQRNDTVSVAK